MQEIEEAARPQTAETFIGVTGIGGASRPLPEREQERPRLSATRLRRPRPKWP